MMTFMSKPAALALLSCCLVFGVLLGLTGLSKDSHTTTTTKPLAAPGLRETARHSMTGSVLASKQEPVKLDDEAMESFMWPELEQKTGGLWGPDDEERLQLEQAENNFKDGKTAGFWETDTAESKELASALLNANWDRLMDADMDMDESFSYSYEM